MGVLLTPVSIPGGGEMLLCRFDSGAMRVNGRSFLRGEGDEDIESKSEKENDITDQ